MTPSEVRMPLAMIEIVNLASLVDQLVEVISASERGNDPAVARLTPDPYPQDPEASSEFLVATRDDLLDRRLADAALVRGTLEPFLDSADDRDDPSEDEVKVEVDVIVRSPELDAWLRTLTALRLVIASRLNIVDDSDLEDAEDPRFNVFHWLGFRLDTLIALADQLDDSVQGSSTTEA